MTENKTPYAAKLSEYSRPRMLAQATSAPAGCASPPSKLAHTTAFVRDRRAKKRGSDIANPSAMLWINRAINTLSPSDGSA